MEFDLVVDLAVAALLGLLLCFAVPKEAFHRLIRQLILMRQHGIHANEKDSELRRLFWCSWHGPTGPWLNLPPLLEH